MASALQVLTLTGVFYEDSGGIQVSEEVGGTLSVFDQLQPLKDLPVRVLAHHLPPDPPLKSQWGGGSCYFQSAGHCPQGHHANPDWLYTFNKAGTLVCLDSVWTVVQGSTEQCYPIPLSELVGHRAQLVVMSLPDFELLEQKLKQRVEELRPENMQNTSIDDLMARAEEMRALMEEIMILKEDL